jgi:methionyl aminopeptidase
MSIQSQRDLLALQRIGRIVAFALQEMKAAMHAGMTTQELDAIGRQVLARYGARPAPELFYGYPAATCISINEEAAHGLPSARRLRDGDLVNLDVSAELDGYVADTGASIPLGVVPPVAQRLCKATQEALQAALGAARAGNRMADLQTAIERIARRHGFAIIRNLSGHGVGRHIHEAPGHVPDYARKKDRRRFEKGMVLTLEPFLSTGPTYAQTMSDGWTLATEPGHLAAQYEHTVVITDAAPIIVTNYKEEL